MTVAAFRKLALSMAGAVEGSHMGHADFRAGKGGKIFASLPRTPKGAREVVGDSPLGMVRVTPEQQAALVKSHPGVFVPAAGAWGRQGCTYVVLKSVKAGVMREAMGAAWAEARDGG